MALEGFPEFIPSTSHLAMRRHLFDESPALTAVLQAQSAKVYQNASAASANTPLLSRHAHGLEIDAILHRPVRIRVGDERQHIPRLHRIRARVQANLLARGEIEERDVLLVLDDGAGGARRPFQVSGVAPHERNHDRGDHQRGRDEARRHVPAAETVDRRRLDFRLRFDGAGHRRQSLCESRSQAMASASAANALMLKPRFAPTVRANCWGSRSVARTSMATLTTPDAARAHWSTK